MRGLLRTVAGLAPLWTAAAMAQSPSPRAPARPEAARPEAARREAARPTPAPSGPPRLRTPPGNPSGEDPGKEEAVPPLEADPFQPPKGVSGRGPAVERKHRIWFLRPSVLFVARFSKDRSFVPKEGFGFGVQAGATLGRSTLRLSLAIAYHFFRLARTLDIVVNDPNLTSCTAIRTFAYHLATASTQATARISRVEIYAGLRGGFALSQLKTPTSTCDTDTQSASTGVLGGELGAGYGLRSDLTLGVSLAYLHFFSDKAYISSDSVRSQFFYDMLTVGVALTLRF